MTPRLQTAAAAKGDVIRPAGCRTVFVKNIPYDAQEDDIKEAMKVWHIITFRYILSHSANQIHQTINRYLLLIRSFT